MSMEKMTLVFNKSNFQVGINRVQEFAKLKNLPIFAKIIRKTSVQNIVPHLGGLATEI